MGNTYLILISLLVTLTPFIILSNAQNRRLNEYIRHYEGISYDANLVQSRAKRSLEKSKDNNAKPETVLHIDFKAHGKDFKLRLNPDVDSVFSKSIRIENPDGKPIDVDLSRIYTGHLHDDPHDSKVFGSVNNEGIFEGKILTSDATYYVERSSRFKKHNSSIPHKSVIYSSNDVQFDEKRGSGCGNEKIRDWMNAISNSAVDEPTDVESDLISEAKHRYRRNTYDTSSSSSSSSSESSPSHYKYNINPHYDYDLSRRTAQSRVSFNNKELAPSPDYVTPQFFSPTVKKRACSLYIQTDTFLWDYIRQDVQSDTEAREEISSLVAQHIKAVNHIYENSDFNGIRGLKFIVQRLRINDSSSCDSSSKRLSNPFCSPNIDVSNFLNLNSQFNHDDFCLAYIFTFRDFSGGTLGLAWVASTSGASGGICEKYKPYTENIHGRQVQTKRSLNTGIITFVNYNSRVPPKVSELTLAHEIGHNFGSPHDYPHDCRPGGPQGNFIMYSSATSGERLNNNKFSPCSIKNVSAVLHAVFSNEGKHNCFEEDNGPFCGNKIVEEGEECDCGYDIRECTEKCCYPRDIKPYKHEDPNAKACHRRRDVRCSPSEGTCCNEECEHESRQKLCRHEGQCTYEAFCSGHQAYCPNPPPKPNKTECNGGTQVCWKGVCAGSICQKYDREECFLTSKNGAKPGEMCEVACQKIDAPATCLRTSEIREMKNISGLKLRPGSPCNDFQGYCDVFQRCRAVDAEGPLARLKNLLLNHKTLSSIKMWVTKHWWACMLMLVGLMLFMAAFIKCCAVHTPSSNPKKKPALRITDTLRKPADTLRRKRSRPPQSRTQQQQQQQGSSIPLQPTAPTLQPSVSQYQSQPLPQQQVTIPQVPLQPSSQQPLHLQQTQLVVTLPPEFRVIQTEPPPPYPGHSNVIAPPPLPPPPAPARQNAGVPSHGYGEGRGHYNRKGQLINPPPPAKMNAAKIVKPNNRKGGSSSAGR